MSAKNITLAELSRMVDGELHGDPDIAIHGLANLATAVAGEIAFLVKAAGIETLKNSHGAAFIVPRTLSYGDKPVIKVANPYLAAAIIQNFFQAKPFQTTGISPKAHIGSDCDIPAETSAQESSSMVALLSAVMASALPLTKTATMSNGHI